MTAETTTAEHGDTLWGIMLRIDGNAKRYEQWQSANPHIGESQLGGGEVVNVPCKFMVL